MKKLISVLLCACLLCTITAVGASAQELSETSPKVTVEVFENGDYFVTEVTQDAPVARSSPVSGSKKGTYYTSTKVAIWSVTVHGTFTYTYGVSATATSATATVALYHKDASFVSKNAYISGASACATATVTYLGYTTIKTVTLTCDKYGRLS